jgi:chaperonin GroEL (HSP60 family)
VHFELILVLHFNFFPQGAITNILEENVVQPLLVSTSAITLASETVCSILKIDDIVSYVGEIMFRGGWFGL